MIYLVQCGSLDYYKVGMVCKDSMLAVANRIKSLQIGNPFPITVLAVWTGGKEEERNIHKEMIEFSVRGEWFRWSPAIEALLNKHFIDENTAAELSFMGIKVDTNSIFSESKQDTGLRKYFDSIETIKTGWGGSVEVEPIK